MKLFVLSFLILILSSALVESQANQDKVVSMINSYEFTKEVANETKSLSPEKTIAIIRSPEFSETLKPQIISQMNEGLARAPKPIKMIIGSERINIYLGEERVGYEFNNAQIKEIYSYGIDDPTLDVIIDKNLLSEQNVDLMRALNEGKIQIKPVGFFKKVKFRILKFGLNIFNKFSKED